MQALPPGGAMVAIEATEDEVAPRIAEAVASGHDDRVAIAAVNGPCAVVVSGDEAAVLAVASALEALGRRTRRLRVSHAFHSPLMEPMLADFRAALARLTFRPPAIPIESTVAPGADLADPEYWVGQVRQAVRFADGMQRLADAGISTFLELGPDGVLAGMAPDARVLPLLRKGHAEPATVDEAVDQARAALDPTAELPAPALPFQRQRYWLEAGSGAAGAGSVGLAAAAQPLLGPTVRLADRGAGSAFTRALRELPEAEREAALTEPGAASMSDEKSVWIESTTRSAGVSASTCATMAPRSTSA
jgi:acyl transferase domain-containing protein